MVGFSGQQTPHWPIIKSAYNTIDKSTLEKYITFENFVLNHNDNMVTKHLDEIINNPVIQFYNPVSECKNEVLTMETIIAYDCQITYPKGANLEKKLEEILKPFDFEEWKIPRLKKLLVNFSRRNEMDGMRVKEKSYICPCRHKHVVDGKNYDLFTEVRDCGLAWNYGENDIDIVERFMDKYPFEPEFRFQLIMSVKKKNNMVRKKLLPSDKSDEEGTILKMNCFSCYQSITFPKFQTDITCKCKHTFQNPYGVVQRECPFDCDGMIKFVKGKVYVTCETCNRTLVLMNCGVCDTTTAAPLEEISKKDFVHCMTCKNEMITPFHQVCRKPKAKIPYLDLFFCSGKPEQMVKVILNNNAKVSETLRLTEEEMKTVESFKDKLCNEKSFFTSEDLNIFISKLFFWPFPQVVPCVDLFKLFLLHKGIKKSLKLNFPERCSLFVDIAFRLRNEKDSWKIFNVVSQCLVNNFAFLDNETPSSIFSAIDIVLKFIDHSLETKNFQVFNYFSKILLK